MLPESGEDRGVHHWGTADVDHRELVFWDGEDVLGDEIIVEAEVGEVGTHQAVLVWGEGLGDLDHHVEHGVLEGRHHGELSGDGHVGYFVEGSEQGESETV